MTGGLFLGFSVLVFLLFELPLHSGFWHDDYYNLFNLAHVKDTGMLPYVLGGIAGPSGRPLALLSFALQHDHWPHNAYAFKWVNLFIHLVNGLLVFIIVHKLLLLAGGQDKGRNYLTALLCAVLWVLHPIQFTTVLYVVQRMTQLSALFSLGGILCYLYFRERYVQGGIRMGLIGMSLAVSVFTGLAVLSKENGILLPLYILVMECTLLKDSCKDSCWKSWAFVFLVGPLLLLCAWLLVNLDEQLQGYAIRHFTPSERLLTQSLILVDYLQNIFLPSPGDFSRYHDDFPVARSLLQPVGTLFACVGIIGVILFAVLKRRQFVYASFAILWFFGGHVLESSLLNLALYYEHRNYLPLLGPVLLISWSVNTLLMRYDQIVIRLLVLLYASSIFLISYLELRTWDDFDRQSFELAAQQPTSYAAWTHVIDTYARLGYRQEMIKAQAHLEGIGENTLLPHIRYLFTKGCYLQEAIPEEKWAQIFRQSEKKDWYSYISVGFLNGLVAEMQEGNCPHVDPLAVLGITLRLANRAEYARFEHMLHELAALLCMYMEDTACALVNTERSLELHESIQKYVLKYNIAIHAGDVAIASQTIAQVKKYLAGNLKAAVAHAEVLKEMESALALMQTVERE